MKKHSLLRGKLRDSWQQCLNSSPEKLSLASGLVNSWVLNNCMDGITGAERLIEACIIAGLKKA